PTRRSSDLHHRFTSQGRSRPERFGYRIQAGEEGTREQDDVGPGIAVAIEFAHGASVEEVGIPESFGKPASAARGDPVLRLSSVDAVVGTVHTLAGSALPCPPMQFTGETVVDRRWFATFSQVESEEAEHALVRDQGLVDVE